MESIGGWLAGKKAEKELNSVGEGLANMANDTAEAITNWWGSMMGKVQKPLPDFLQILGLPKGLFPKNILKYKFDAKEGSSPDYPEGILTVSSASDMEVRFGDGTLLRYKKTLTALVTKGKLDSVSGLRMSGVTGWTDISCVTADGSNLVFKARIKKSKAANVFESLREGVTVEEIK